MTSTRLIMCMFAAMALNACGGKTPQPVATTTPDAATPTTAAPAPAEAASEDGITARAMLEQALAEARNWAPDAELIGVATSLTEGPRHGFWFYDVQSRAKGACTRIRALANGGVSNVGTGDGCMLMKPVSLAFVDSPAAWDAARAAGFNPGDSAQFGLRFQRDEALPQAREC